MEGWYGQSIDKPLAEIREYVEIMRAIFRGEDPPPGEKFRTGFHFMGYEPLRSDLPIYLAGLSPGMLRLAGEVADGVILWLCNPNYIRDVVVPTVREGREKAGKDATTLGAGFLAGLAVGVWSDVDDLAAAWRPSATIDPGPPLDRERWAEAVERARGWIPSLSALDF